MAIYVDKHKKDPESKNEMISQLKYNLEDKIAKKKVSKGFKENTCPIKVIFLIKSQ